MINPFSMQNKTVLVTGASSGLGQATAIMLSGMGAKLILTGRDQQRLQHTIDSLEGTGHKSFAVDLTHVEDRDKFISSLPSLDGFFYSAGVSKMAPLKYMPDSTLDEIFDINFFVPIKITRSLIKKKLLNPQASLLYMSSIAPFLGITGQVGYSASKGSLLASVRIIAKELAQYKIRANCLCPAMIQTPLLTDSPVDKKQYEKDQAGYPLGGYGLPEDVAAAAVYFLSPASRWITGTYLIMDGGLTLS